MTIPPEACTYSAICELFNSGNCAGLLEGAHIDLLDSSKFDPPANGTAAYRFEQHTSRDGRCVVQYDVYTAEDGREVRFIYSVEINGQEFIALYDRPKPVWDEF